MTPADVISRAQEKLHDLNYSTWTETELFDWVKDGVLSIFADTDPALTFSVYDLPPRHTWSYSHEWERELLDGPSRKFTYSQPSSPDGFECTQLFETSDLNSDNQNTTEWNVTALWELAQVGSATDLTYKVVLPKSNSEIRAVWYKEERLEPTYHQRLDNNNDAWWKVQGEPVLWTTTLGKEDEFVVFEIRTTDVQSYHTIKSERGIPRRITGERSYQLDGTNMYGIMRSISSPDRQYFTSHQWQRYGTLRRFGSDAEGLLVWHTVVPDIDFIELDTELALLPTFAHKYLIYFVLFMAFNQRGEGYDPVMSQHYFNRFKRVSRVMGRMQSSVFEAATYARAPTRRTLKSRPWPRLPSNFEQPRRLI